MPVRQHPKQDGVGGLQIPLFSLESSWRPPNVANLPDWPRNGRVSLDVECKDVDLKKLGPGVRRKDQRMVGFGFTIDGGPSYYVPLSHEGGDNVENPEAALAYLAVQARQFHGILTGANLSYDLDWCAQEKANFLEGPCQLRDIQVADPLINELHFKYNLEVVCERWGLEGKDEEMLRAASDHYELEDPKRDMYLLPARYVGRYNEIDTIRPLEVLRLQEKEIEKQNLWQIFNLECKVQKVLTKLRRRGVRIDQDKLAQIETWCVEQETIALAKVKHQTGIDVGLNNVWKVRALVPVLDYLGIDYELTEKNKQPKIDKFSLEAIDHPVAKHLAWARKTNKLRTTFANSIRTHMVNGRIHCTFNQLRKTKEDGETRGAAYGRLSSENPNMQQQPARDDFAVMWRSIYLPEEGSVWGALDYSQQEPRMLVHFAEKMKLSGARDAGEAYRTDPTTDNHQMMADMAGIARTPAKILFLGKCYGMGGAKLCHDLGLPTRWAVSYKDPLKRNVYFDNNAQAIKIAIETGGSAWEAAGIEGQQLIHRFDKKLPFVKALAKKAEKVAKERGYIITILRRRCRFPLDNAGKYDWVYKALNRLIQGSSADQTKQALVDIDRAGHFIQLQVHDEIDGSFAGAEDAGEAAEIMENCIAGLTVPFKVDIELGTSWGNSMEKT